MLPTGTDGQGTVLLGYDGFEVACLHSKIAPCALPSEIAGEDGVLTLDDCSVPTQVRLHRRVAAPGQATAQSFTREHASVEDIAPGQDAQHMRYEVEEFATLLRGGATESALHPPSRSLAALRILDEARRQVGVVFPNDRPSSPRPAPRDVRAVWATSLRGCRLGSLAPAVGAPLGARAIPAAPRRRASPHLSPHGVSGSA